jgi:exonuclease V
LKQCTEFAGMAGLAFDSGSEDGYDPTGSDEDLLLAIVDRFSPVPPQPQPTPATPTRPAPRSKALIPARNAVSSSPFSPNLDPDAIFAVDETIAAISDDDLSFDISELHDATPVHGQRPEHEQVHNVSRGSTVQRHSRRLAPSVTGSDNGLSSFVSKTKPRHMPTLLPGPDVRYPDCTSFMSPARHK